MNEYDPEKTDNHESDAGQAERRLEGEKVFAAEFARRIIAGDFPGAHEYLAPWLGRELSPDALREAFERELWEMNGYWEIDELILPADFTISWNSSTLDDLKQPMSWREPRPFSDELTADNFRRWMVIAFLPDESDERIEFDGWFDFWCAVAEVEGQLKIGYFEFEDPD